MMIYPYNLNIKPYMFEALVQANNYLTFLKAGKYTIVWTVDRTQFGIGIFLFEPIFCQWVVF